MYVQRHVYARYGVWTWCDVSFTQSLSPRPTVLIRCLTNGPCEPAWALGNQVSSLDDSVWATGGIRSRADIFSVRSLLRLRITSHRDWSNASARVASFQPNQKIGFLKPIWSSQWFFVKMMATHPMELHLRKIADKEFWKAAPMVS